MEDNQDHFDDVILLFNEPITIFLPVFSALCIKLSLAFEKQTVRFSEGSTDLLRTLST